MKRSMQVDFEARRWRAAVEDIVSDLKPQSILDVGCGDAVWVTEMARRFKVPSDKVYGLEVYPPYLQDARRRLRVFEVDLETQRWPLEDQSVDLLIINQVLEHLKNVYFCLAECERVLSVGGHLVIGIPNLSGLVNRLYLLLGRQPMCIGIPGPHVRAFAHKAFVDLIRANPAFELKRCAGASLYPLPWPLVEYGAKRLPGLSAYTFYLAKKVKHRRRSAWLEMIGYIEATSYRQ